MTDTHVAQETRRVAAEYKRREREIENDLYAPWQPGEILMTSERKRTAALMLRELQLFPTAGDRCLEIGFGRIGWLADLISWGIMESDLYGIELDSERARQAKNLLPSAHLMAGDATDLPWEDAYFQYVVVSTVFSSILNADVRNRLAEEISRVVCNGGAVILYDLRINNPQNSKVKRLSRKDVENMFPNFNHNFRSITLAPPIARFVAAKCWLLAVLLGTIPFLRTHFVAALVKPTT